MPVQERGSVDRRVVACNFQRSHSAIRKGALAYVYMPNPGGGHDRIWCLVRSRGGRWIEQWEAIKHLDNFRAKTIPPEHPLYDDQRLWDLNADEMAATMQRRSEEARS